MSLPLPLAFRDPDAQPLGPAMPKSLPPTKEQIAEEVLRAFEQDVEFVGGDEEISRAADDLRIAIDADLLAAWTPTVDGSEYTTVGVDPAINDLKWQNINAVIWHELNPLIEAHEAVTPEAPLTETEKWKKAFADPKTGLSFHARIAAENLRNYLK